MKRGGIVLADAPRPHEAAVFNHAVERAEQAAYLVELLRRHEGNISRAAIEAGIDRKTIHRLLNKHGVRLD